MSEVQCLYCGKSIPAAEAICPGCGAPSHFQRKGLRRLAERRFLLFFILVVAFSFLMIFYLPR